MRQWDMVMEEHFRFKQKTLKVYTGTRGCTMTRDITTDKKLEGWNKKKQQQKTKRERYIGIAHSLLIYQNHK